MTNLPTGYIPPLVVHEIANIYDKMEQNNITISTSSALQFTPERFHPVYRCCGKCLKEFDPSAVCAFARQLRRTEDAVIVQPPFGERGQVPRSRTVHGGLGCKGLCARS